MFIRWGSSRWNIEGDYYLKMLLICFLREQSVEYLRGLLSEGVACMLADGVAGGAFKGDVT